MMQLDSAETARALPYAELVPAIARAATELATGVLNVPERLVTRIGSNGTLLCMPAVGPDLGITKIVTVHTQNKQHHLPAIQGEVIVFESDTGRRVLLLDGPTLTARRTAAVTLVAIDKLAPRPPRTALLIGTGVQAAAHVEALSQYFGVRSFQIVGRQMSSAVQFCEQLQLAHHDIRATAMTLPDPHSAAIDVDLVIALTTSHLPVIPECLPDSTLAIGVGAFRPEMAELPSALLNKRHIVVDHRKGAEHEAGDLLRAAVRWTEVTELSQLVTSNRKEVRGPFVFKSVGHASWDLAAARVALRSREAT